MGNVVSEAANEIHVPNVRVPSKSSYSFLTTKIWIIPSKTLSRNRKTRRLSSLNLGFVIFRTNTATGDRKLYVNNDLIKESKDFFDGSGMMMFTLEEHSYRLEILSFPGLSEYNLFYDGQRLPSIMELQEPHNIEHPKVSVREAFLVADGVDIKASNSDKFELQQMRSNCCVHFDIYTEYRGTQYVTKKRFADFDTLDCLVRSTFKGHHLYNNLPALPKKCVKAVTNHYTKDFIEERRLGLNRYIKHLLSIPHTVNNPDILQFLGIPLIPMTFDSSM